MVATASNYSLEYIGFLRSWLALTTSLRSFESSVAAFQLATYSRPSVTEWSLHNTLVARMHSSHCPASYLTVTHLAWSSTCLVPTSASGDFAAISAAQAWAAACTASASGRHCVTSPICSASEALNVLPVSASSLARPASECHFYWDDRAAAEYGESCVYAACLGPQSLASAARCRYQL